MGLYLVKRILDRHGAECTIENTDAGVRTLYPFLIPSRKESDNMEIKIQNVSMTYPSGKQALKGLNLELKSPSLIGLLGPNGAGKSTLIKLLAAALQPTEGNILVDRMPLSKAESHLKASLGYLPQDFGLFDELTVTQF